MDVGRYPCRAAQLQILASNYDQMSVGMIANVFTEGVAGSDGRVVGDSPMGGDEASGLVWQNLPTAPRLAVQRGLRSMKVEECRGQSCSACSGLD